MSGFRACTGSASSASRGSSRRQAICRDAIDNPSRKVWKRLGLAVFDGRAQRRTRDAEKAVEQGYSPRRRSVSWVAFHSVYLAQSARKDPGGQCHA